MSSEPLGDAREYGTALSRRSLARAAAYFFGSAAAAVGLGAALALCNPGAVATGGLGLAKLLIGWKMDIAQAAPEWLVIMVNNLACAAVVMFLGPLGCALELKMRAKSSWYAALCRGMARRRRTVFRIFDRRLDDLPAGGIREGLTIAVLVPALTTLANGGLFGAVALASSLSPEIGFVKFVRITAPHGVIELAAILLAAAVGFEHAEVLFARAGNAEQLHRASMGRVSEPAVLRSAVLVAGLLAAAAVIEGQLIPAFCCNFVWR